MIKCTSDITFTFRKIILSLAFLYNTILLGQLPDLTIEMNMDVTTYLNGETVSGSYSVTNIGNAAILDEFEIGMFLIDEEPSDEDQFDDDNDNEVNDDDCNEDDNCSTSATCCTRNFSFNLPITISPGNYYVVLSVDYENAIEESEETNNVVYIPIIVELSTATFDVNGDGITNIIDLISTVEVILNFDYSSFVDVTNDGIVNLLDVSYIMYIILPSINPATYVQLNIGTTHLTYDSDGKFNILFHLLEDPFTALNLTNDAFLANYQVSGDSTRIIIIHPDSLNLFAFEGQMTENRVISAAANYSYIPININNVNCTFDLTYPLGDSIDTVMPEFEWNFALNEISMNCFMNNQFEIWMSDSLDPDVENPQWTFNQIDGSPFVFPTDENVLMPNKQYYWKMRGIGSNEVYNWSEISTFKTKPIGYVNPDHEATNQSLTPYFIWEGPSGVPYYELWVTGESDENVINPFYVASMLTNTQFLYIVSGEDALEYEHTYHWKIVPLDNNENSGNPSDVFTFSTYADHLQIPDTVFTILEDESITLDFTPYINFANFDTTNINLLSDGGVQIIVDIDEYDVTLSGNPNWHGNEEVIFTIENNLLNISMQDTAQLHILSVNDPPLIMIEGDSIFIEEDVLFNIINFDITPGAYSEEDQLITARVDAISDSSLILDASISYQTGNINGTFIIVPDQNAYGNTSIDISLNDNGGTDNGGINETMQTIPIIISPINDQPIVEIRSCPDDTLGIDLYDFSWNGADVDDSLLTYHYNMDDWSQSLSTTDTFITINEISEGHRIFYLKAEDELGLMSESDSCEFYINLCSNVICENYCSGNTLYFSGECSSGDCFYSSEYCVNGCNDGQCNDENFRLIEQNLDTLLSLSNMSLTFEFSQPIDNYDENSVVINSTYGNEIFEMSLVDEGSGILLEIEQLASLDTVSITFVSDHLTSTFGLTLDGNQNGIYEGSPEDDVTFNYESAMLGDYDYNFILDHQDLEAFIQGWYNKDYLYELGPYLGEVPNLIPQFDNIYNIEDLSAFFFMWKWSDQNTDASRINIFSNFGPEPMIDINDNHINFNLENIDLSIASFRVLLNTNNSNIKLYEHALENIFDIYLFRQWEEDNIYEWSMADFNNNDINHFSLAHLNYEISNEQSIQLEYEFKNYAGEIISNGYKEFTIEPIPNSFILYEPYPNPFNPLTKVSYAIPYQAKIQIVIYNMMGQEIFELYNGTQNPGYYSINWNATQFSSGNYFVKLISDDFVKTQKIILIK